MPIWDHLEELRWTIFKTMGTLAVTTGIGLACTDWMYALLKRPLNGLEDKVKLVFAAPLDGILFQLKLALFGGCLMAAPFVFYFIWEFVSPALKEVEKRAFWVSLGTGLVFFAIGISFGYYLLPFGLPLLVAFGKDGIQQLWSISAYVGFCFRLLLGCGVIFELPVVLTVMVRMGLVRVETLARNRPFAVIIALFVAAILTPPDPISQAVLALPIILLYELSIISGRWQERRRLEREEEDGFASDDTPAAGPPRTAAEPQDAGVAATPDSPSPAQDNEAAIGPDYVPEADGELPGHDESDYYDNDYYSDEDFQGWNEAIGEPEPSAATPEPTAPEQDDADREDSTEQGPAQDNAPPVSDGATKDEGAPEDGPGDEPER